MKWLIKERMNLYKYVMIIYAICLNILFYSSGNLVVVFLASCANVCAILTIIGFIQFNKTRQKEKQERELRREQRKAQKNELRG